MKIRKSDSDSFENKVGSIIAELRQDRKITQVKMAESLGICKSTYAHYEQGVTVPPFEMVKQIADIFDVNVDYLIGNSDCNIKYTEFKNKFSDDFTYGELFNILFTLSKKDRQHISYDIELMVRKKRV